MGVPKFYRWISERYPCLSEVVKEHQISEFDNLYLDMNGIIHVVSHPDDSNPHFRITEEKIFRDVFHYIEVLFRLIKPRKAFFMAIDGCAPRAKMNQQRGRRFRSAREAEELIAKAVSKGEVLPSEDRFDSNCITPGTPFMARLQEQLKYFVTDRVSNNALWQGPRIYLSGHEVPGEGEHKIMDFIRSERAKPDHDPNTRHCLYGLDADLMMLGLVTHEPHFSLLREEVRFGGKDSQKRSTTPEDTTFHLLHLSLLREYIDFEFAALKNNANLAFDYDLDRVIDDWVLMGFLVGNDFVPNLPNLHIAHDGLPLLWGVYMNVLPTMDGYLNEDGKINLERFEKFMAELAKFDFEKFSENYADLKWFAGKTGGKGFKKKKGKESPERKKYNQRKAEELYKKANKFQALEDDVEDPESLMFDYDAIEAGLQGFDDDDDNDDAPMTDAQAMLTNGALSSDAQDQLMMDEFKHHKRGYYIEKLHVECVTLPFLQDQALQYVRALQWILYYYYDGCPSWSWFYPFHYAPYISDVHSFSQVTIKFDLSKPFLPFQQLMAVLPAASKKLLPECYHPLMTEESSPIHEFYPVQFETDLNGKQQEWEAVVLIPFIDEKRLLDAMATVEDRLKPEERARNTHGPCWLYTHATEPQPEFLSQMPDVFPDILINYAKATKVGMWDFAIPRESLRRGLCDDVMLDVHFPGFPTFKHIPHTSKLKKANVKVFQAMSRGENMLISPVYTDRDKAVHDVAKQLLGKTVFVRWPHLVEARCEAVSDGHTKLSIVRGGKDSKKEGTEQWQRKELNDYETSKYMMDRDALADQHYSRRGLVLGQVRILVYVQPLLGRRYICGSHGNITLDKQYSVQQEYYAHQTIVTDLQSHCPGFQQFTTIEELFPEDSDVFMLGKLEYGAQGKVLGIHEQGHVRVKFKIKSEPDFTDVMHKEKQLSLHYLPSWMVAQRLSISSHLVSKITGCYRVANGQDQQTVDIGLNLKSNVKGQEVPGFTKKQNEQWVYSTKVVQVLDQYMRDWPHVFEVIMKKSESEITMDELFPEGSEKNIHDLKKYVKSLECSVVPRVAHGCDLIDEPVIAIIERQLVAVTEANAKTRKTQTMQVRPHLLYKPIIGNDVIPDASAEYRLFDRVVNVRIGFSVPLGLRGTVIGIYPGEREIDTMYEVLFDEEFVDALKIRCSSNRAYRLYGLALINISHGERKSRSQKMNVLKNKNTNINNVWKEEKSRKGQSKNREFDSRNSDSGRELFNDVWSDLKKSSTGSPKKGKQRHEDIESYSKCVSKDKSRDGGKSHSPVAKEVYGKMTVLGRKNSGSKSRQKTSEIQENGVGSLNMAAMALPTVVSAPKPGAANSEPPSDSQFAQLMDCLEIASKVDAPQAPQNAASKAVPKEQAKGASQPVYGTKLTVDELFKVAQKDGVENPPQPPQPPDAKWIQELLAWSMSHHLSPPRYDPVPAGQSGHVCQVILGNQLRFQSSSCKTAEAAAQSAAAVALNYLRKGQTGPRPSSAFRPVQPARTQGAQGPPVQPVSPRPQNQALSPRPHQTPQAQPVSPRPLVQPVSPRPQLQQQAQNQQIQNQLKAALQNPLHPAAQGLWQQQHIRPHSMFWNPMMNQGLVRPNPLLNPTAILNPPPLPGTIGQGHAGQIPGYVQANAQNLALLTQIQLMQAQAQQRASVQRPSPQIYQPPAARAAQAYQGHQKGAEGDSSSQGTSSRKGSSGAQAAPGVQQTSAPDETSRKRTDSTSANPFVPLQVSRQQKTPQKKSASVERDEAGKTKLSSADITQSAQKSTRATDEKAANNENKPKKTKKQSSRRMAAMFPANS